MSGIHPGKRGQQDPQVPERDTPGTALMCGDLVTMGLPVTKPPTLNPFSPTEEFFEIYLKKIKKKRK